MDKRKIYFFWALPFAVAGLAMMVIDSGWMTASGVFLLIWADNISRYKS